jgi:hypothetical protein
MHNLNNNDLISATLKSLMQYEVEYYIYDTLILDKEYLNN